jgi:hypothetical protein
VDFRSLSNEQAGQEERTDELAENAPHIAPVFSSSYLAMCRIAILLVARP